MVTWPAENTCCHGYGASRRYCYGYPLCTACPSVRMSVTTCAATPVRPAPSPASGEPIRTVVYCEPIRTLNLLSANQNALFTVSQSEQLFTVSQSERSSCFQVSLYEVCERPPLPELLPEGETLQETQHTPPCAGVLHTGTHTHTHTHARTHARTQVNNTGELIDCCSPPGGSLCPR